MARAETDPADDLYGLPLAEFTAARDRLAGELKKAGRAEAARTVKGLAKPTASAWALNQVARRSPDLLEALFGTSDELGQAQASAGATAEGRARYRAAVDEQRRAIDEVVRAAQAALGEAGLGAGAAVLDRVANDLRWGAAGEETRALLRAGRLARDLEPQDLGALLGRMPVASTAALGKPLAGRAAAAKPAPAPAPASKAARPAPKLEVVPSSAEDRARREHERERAAQRAALAAELRAAEQTTRRAQGELERREGNCQRVQARIEELRVELSRRERELATEQGEREAARKAVATGETAQATLGRRLEALGKAAD